MKAELIKRLMNIKYLAFVFKSMVYCAAIISCNSAEHNEDVENGIDTSIVNLKAPTIPVSPEVELMKKYSELVWALDKNDKALMQGTGFFLTYKRQLFFITNKHVAYPENASYLQIFLDSGSYIIKFSDFPTDTIKDTDLAAFRITDRTFPYHDVADAFDLTYLSKTPISYIAWGFPEPTHKSDTLAYNEKLFTGPFISSDDLAEKTFKASNPNVTVNGIHFSDQTGSFLLPFPLVHGMSGSPIFGVFIEPNREVVKFVGIVKQTDTIHKLGRGIPASTITDYLNQKSRRK